MHKLNNAARQFECGPPSGFTCGLAVNAVEREEGERVFGEGRLSVHVAYYRHRQTLSAPRHTHTHTHPGSDTGRQGVEHAGACIKHVSAQWQQIESIISNHGLTMRIDF